MFKDLLLFEKERTPQEALGFYLAYLLLLLLLGGLLAFLIVPHDPSKTFAEEFQAGASVGWTTAVIFCLALSFMILYKKKKLQDFGLVLIGISSGICAILLGGLLGLVPTAYLTTVKNYNNEEKESGREISS
ncbi:MAG: hypothetical protein VYD02_00120 [Pseudomonadota bacterium]|nr:hypothetical protein [Pseudomonadota bacterium]